MLISYLLTASAAVMAVNAIPAYKSGNETSSSDSYSQGHQVYFPFRSFQGPFNFADHLYSTAIARGFMKYRMW